MSDAEVSNLGAKFNMEILEEASYVLWHVWRTLHPKFSTLQACISALSEDTGLYRTLKLAHTHGKYDAVRSWKASPTQIDPSAALNKFLAEIRPAMTRLVKGDISLPLWTPEFEDELSMHLQNLKIPFLKGRPNVLLHDLGSFKDDKNLANRLRNIFMANNHTFLVNTSGSGKTRLLLEGLCEYWGFYFTSLVDSSLLGSSDVQNSIRTYVPDSPHFRTTLPQVNSSNYEKALKTNRDNANRIFSQVFLARLMIFDLFAEVMDQHRARHTDQHVYRYRWLLLQLQPSLIHPQVWDVFDHMVGKLSLAADSYINSKTKALLARVRKFCTDDSIGSLHPAQTPLFCVLDEAQYAATEHCSAFRSNNGDAHRPILREIVRAWEGQSFGQGVFMVVAGTGISKDVVDQAVASAIMKDSKYRWCSDTGAFDDIEVQRRYILKYIPQSLIDTRSGRHLLERMWYWLRGRHRFTAGFIAELLSSGFRKPHALLNTYIEHFTHFIPTDAHELVKAEGAGSISISSRYKLDFGKLKKNSDMIATIHHITTHYLMRSVLPASLGKDEATYVEYGFARFVDSETNNVAVDEPLVLLAAAHWTNANYRSTYKFFAKEIHLHDPNSNGFENYLAFCLNLTFSKKCRLNQIFTFCSPAPHWASQEAELVTLYRTVLGDVEHGLVRHSDFSGPSVTLGVNAKTTSGTSAWLAHQNRSPMCFPHASMGPDILFILKLLDGSFMWVALQAKYSLGKNGVLSRTFLRRAMRSVTPSHFFINKDGTQHSPSANPTLAADTLDRFNQLPHKRSDSGKYCLLRVVASFPCATNLKRCLEEDPDQDAHPIAALNMNFIKSITKRLSPVDFLDGLGHSPNSGMKRKGSFDSQKRTKKLKLN